MTKCHSFCGSLQVLQVHTLLQVTGAAAQPQEAGD
jgi:hypothetical protein